MTTRSTDSADPFSADPGERALSARRHAEVAFDFEYLKQMFVEFRQRMGERSVMLDADRRGRYFEALFFAVGNTTLTSEQHELVDAWWSATALEFMRRCELIDSTERGDRAIAAYERRAAR